MTNASFVPYLMHFAYSNGNSVITLADRCLLSIIVRTPADLDPGSRYQPHGRNGFSLFRA